jgi:hypothetical protein
VCCQNIPKSNTSFSDPHEQEKRGKTILLTCSLYAGKKEEQMSAIMQVLRVT